MKRPSSWSDTSFWPISLKENQQKGCQKGEKPTFTKSKSLFKPQDDLVS